MFPPEYLRGKTWNVTIFINLVIPLEMLGFPSWITISFSSQLWYITSFTYLNCVFLTLEFSPLSFLLSFGFTFSDVYLIYLSGCTTDFSPTLQWAFFQTLHFQPSSNCILYLHYWFCWKVLPFTQARKLENLCVIFYSSFHLSLCV